ncbi:hypothetical protein C8D87_106390 [Lentzea atacamensis]|uniref:Uncharacterized protein n=1 Tax=Lentzea atacamensis TaxID=531938 RepID=A0ABX9E684_9PSEU|nr:hypothetical protein [Lentzea atacamensis]RAS63986.1 hypothetical protein C8D87_106390 [Lentzea atacamensis]
MPRRRPVPPRGRLRPIHGASTRLLADLHRHGGADALEQWSDFVRNPFHRRWLKEHEAHYDYEAGEALWSRELLDHVIARLPRRGARELRELVEKLDDLC